MQVEIFEDVEVDCGLEIQDKDEIHALASELKLEGQLEFLDTPDVDEVFPYKQASREEELVYTTLYPTETLLDKYNASVIPKRVLLEAKRATPHFKTLRVWHTPVRDPDPVLVGYTGEKFDGKNKICLIARWGDALQPYAELLVKAKEVAVKKVISSATVEIVDLKARIENAVALIDKKFAGGYVGF